MLPDKVYQDRYRARHPERKAASAAAWRAKNPERVRAIAAASYQKHKDARRERRRLRRQADPSLQARENLRYRCIPIHITAQEMRLIMANEPTCAYCDNPATAFEHCTPVARGGENATYNLVRACKSCNSSKGAKTVLEFMGLWPRAA